MYRNNLWRIVYYYAYILCTVLINRRLEIFLIVDFKVCAKAKFVFVIPLLCGIKASMGSQKPYKFFVLVKWYLCYFLLLNIWFSSSATYFKDNFKDIVAKNIISTRSSTPLLGRGTDLATKTAIKIMISQR